MSKRAKKEKRPVAKIDFKPYGAAIKAGRTKQKESRNKAADALFISPRYLANIENKGQHPSVQVFLELMSRYHISVDQILHGETIQNSALALVQCPIPQNRLSDLRFCLIHTKATVLYEKPHARMTEKQSCSSGIVVHRNNTQSSAASVPTGSARISSSAIVG